MEETRIDVSAQTPEELELAKYHAQLAFRFNHTMPMTEEYDNLMAELFQGIGKGSIVHAPVTVIRPHMVAIGANVVIMNNCLMMAAGGITIEDDVMIAANVQLISNNHDLDNRWIITCKPVRIKKRAWIGAGATILPGVTIGENAVVGACAVVTRDVEKNCIAVGNPAKIIRKI